jgi:hypothetical protein
MPLLSETRGGQQHGQKLSASRRDGDEQQTM